MTDEPRRCWDERYHAAAGAPPPARVLVDHAHLLPAAGQALDLACGLGANALLLAARGLETWAWDNSPVAIARLNAAATAAGVALHTAVRDVIVQPPEPARFDVIVVSHFLERSLASALQAALRPPGCCSIRPSPKPGWRAQAVLRILLFCWTITNCSACSPRSRCGFTGKRDCWATLVRGFATQPC